LSAGQSQPARCQRFPDDRVGAPARCARLRALASGELPGAQRRARHRIAADGQADSGDTSMTRWIASTLALAIVLSPVLARADDNPDASALITLAKMK